MTKDSMDFPERDAGACAHSVPETDLQTAEDLSFFIWREIFSAIVRNEKHALESFKRVELDVEVKQSDGHCSEMERIIKIGVVCEPGKPPRLSSALQI
jgi:hypothetical protein